MTKTEEKNLTDLIEYLKKEWRDHPHNGTFQGIRENQIRHDCLQAVVHFFNLDIEVDMNPLPKDFELKKYIRKGKRKFKKA